MWIEKRHGYGADERWSWLGKLKRALGKTLSAVAVIGVAAVGVAAVLTIGSVITRKKESGVSRSESGVSDSNETDIGVRGQESQAPDDLNSSPAS